MATSFYFGKKTGILKSRSGHHVRVKELGRRCPARTETVLLSAATAQRMGNQGSQVCTTANEELDALVHDALKKGNVECLRLILKSGFSANAVVTGNSRGLHIAARYNQPECMDVLLKMGANRNLPDGSGETPLHIAAECGSRDCVDLLIQARVHLECRDIWRRTPLLKAVVNHHYTIASMLMAAGASVNAADDDKKVPLHVAASYGNSRGVSELLKFGADIDFQDLNGRTALYFGVLSGHNHIVDNLIRHGCNVNLRRREGTKALYLATKKQNLNCVRQLLEAGADTVHIDPRNYQNKDELVRIAIRQLGSQGKTPPDAFEILNLTITAHGLVPGQQLMSSALTHYKKQPNEDMRLVIHRLILAGGVVKVPDSGSNSPTIGYQELQEAVSKWQMEHGIGNPKAPPTLKDVCRRLIRSSIMQSSTAGNVLCACDRLHLPKALKEIILLQRL